MSSSASGANGLVVVTHVYPQQSPPAGPTASTAAHAPCATPNVPPMLGMFLKGEPKALGTVQIVIALVIALFGIVLAVNVDSISVFSGIVFWGSVIFISSGTLTVAASNKLNRCLMKAALGMNITSSFCAASAIFILSVDLCINLRQYCDYHTTEYSPCDILLHIYESTSKGIIGVLLALSILEFIVSICVSGFICRAVSDCSPTQVMFVPHTITQVNTIAPGNLFIPAPSTYEGIFQHYPNQNNLMTVPPNVGQCEAGSFDVYSTSRHTEKPPDYVEVSP